MALPQPTLYGTYEYSDNSLDSAVGNLYGNSFIPETFTLPFEEIVSESDVSVYNTTLALLDTLAGTDTIVSLYTLVEADLITLSDVESFLTTKVLSDSLSSPIDSISISFTKSLSDVLLMQDWISIRLYQPGIWTTPIIGLPLSTDGTMYGTTQYGKVVYGNLANTVWSAQAPTTPSVNGWRSYNQLESMD